MEFLIGIFIGVILSLAVFGSRMPAEHKAYMIRCLSMLERFEDYVESQEREGRIVYTGTSLQKDMQEIETDAERMMKEAEERRGQ